MMSLVSNILGLAIFLFVFWKRLREDYIANQIFGSSFFILASLFMGRIIANHFTPDYWFWISLVAIAVGFVIALYRYELKIFESVEALIISFLPWVSLVFLGDAVDNAKATSLVASLVVFMLIIIFFVVEKHYKKFIWYKSGRVGFPGLMVIGLFFLIRAAVAPFTDGVLSFSGSNDIYFSAIGAFCAFLVVFNLAKVK